MLPSEMATKLLGPTARELGRWLDTLANWREVVAAALEERRGTRATAYRNNQETTAATDFEALPGMSVTVAGGAGDLLVWFQDSSQTDSDGNSVTYGLFVDGVQVNGVTFTSTGAGYGQPVGLHHMQPVASGTHTVAVQWKVSGGTGYSNTQNNVNGQTRLTAKIERW